MGAPSAGAGAMAGASAADGDGAPSCVYCWASLMAAVAPAMTAAAVSRARCASEVGLRLLSCGAGAEAGLPTGRAAGTAAAGDLWGVQVQQVVSSGLKYPKS